MELLHDIFTVFIGFISGIFFEKWTESRNEKKWVRLALLSLLSDLILDHKIFKPVLKMDRNRIDNDKKLVSSLNNQTSSKKMFEIFDQVFKNSEKNKIWSNVANDESNYIDLNRANYDNFLKNSNRDDLLDNSLKANLDWLFEGLMTVYRTNRNFLLKAEYDLKKKLTEFGYPASSAIDKKSNPDFFLRNQILSYFEIYFDFREKDLLIKKDIIEAFEANIKRIKKNLKEPIISDVYKKHYKIPSID